MTSPIWRPPTRAWDPVVRRSSTRARRPIGPGSDAELAAAELARLLGEGPQKEPPAPTRRTLPEIDGSLENSRTSVERALREISRLEHVAAENEELRSAGVCPRCHQKVDPSEFGAHFEEVSTELARCRAGLADLREAGEKLVDERRARERFERSHQRWVDLDAGRASARDRAARAAAQGEAAVARLADLESQVRGAGEEVERLRGHAEEARSALAELDRLESERASAERRLAEIAAQLEGLGGAAATLTRLAADLDENDRERAELELQIRGRRERLAALRSRLAELPRLEGEITSARERRELVRRATAQSERSLERARTLVESARSRLEEIGRLLAERLERLEAAGRHRELAGWFGQTFREAVLALEHRLLARAQVEFEREFTRFFTILVEDPGLIARCDAAFSPAVEIDGEWTPAEALSGGRADGPGACVPARARPGRPGGRTPPPRDVDPR